MYANQSHKLKCYLHRISNAEVRSWLITLAGLSGWGISEASVASATVTLSRSGACTLLAVRVASFRQKQTRENKQKQHDTIQQTDELTWTENLTLVAVVGHNSWLHFSATFANSFSAKIDFTNISSFKRSLAAFNLFIVIVLSLYHTQPTVSTVRPVRSVLRSLRWLDRTKFVLKSKKPVRSIRSRDHRNRMGSVIQALVKFYSIIIFIFSTLSLMLRFYYILYIFVYVYGAAYKWLILSCSCLWAALLYTFAELFCCTCVGSWI